MKQRYSHERWLWYIVTTMIFAILFNPAVYAGLFDNYAKFKRISDINDYITGTQALPDYNYYYTGRSHLPYAVIGVDKNLGLNSKFWNKIDTKEMVVEKVDDLFPIHPYNFSVSRILDKDGKQIGIWFSYYPSTIVKFEQGRDLTVLSPYKPSRFRD